MHPCSTHPWPARQERVAGPRPDDRFWRGLTSPVLQRRHLATHLHKRKTPRVSLRNNTGKSRGICRKREGGGKAAGFVIKLHPAGLPRVATGGKGQPRNRAYQRAKQAVRRSNTCRLVTPDSLRRKCTWPLYRQRTVSICPHCGCGCMAGPAAGARCAALAGRTAGPRPRCRCACR